MYVCILKSKQYKKTLAKKILNFKKQQQQHSEIFLLVFTMC